jgi:hypothetical protein
MEVGVVGRAAVAMIGLTSAAMDSAMNGEQSKSFDGYGGVIGYWSAHVAAGRKLEAMAEVMSASYNCEAL